MIILDLLPLIISIKRYLKPKKKESYLTGGVAMALAFINLLLTIGVLSTQSNGLGLLSLDSHLIGAIGLLLDILCLFFFLRKPKAKTDLLPFQMKKVDKKTRQEMEQQALKEEIMEANEKAVSSCFGNAKIRKQIIERKVAEQKAQEALGILSKAVRNSAQQTKEVNWAVAGGIASGLGGPVAGAMAAADAMIKNQEIRAENERNQKYANQLADNVTAEFSRSLRESNDWLSEINRLYERHEKTITWSLANLFSQLAITTRTIKVNPLTGGVEVVAAWTNKSQMWIDGSIRGKLYTKDGKLTGCVYLNLPIGGTMAAEQNEINTLLTGHCAKPIIKETEYTIRYEPINLWRLIYGLDASKAGDGTTEERHKEQVQSSERTYLDELTKTRRGIR